MSSVLLIIILQFVKLSCERTSVFVHEIPIITSVLLDVEL